MRCSSSSPRYGVTGVKAHPLAARDYVEQAARALDFARENPEETREILARILEARGENPEVARYFAGYGVREGGLAVPRDVQIWIDVLVRDGVIAEGQMKASDILLVISDQPATN
jgi:ABC-type nitrate/sulfonate/bicarbonate transport system substrate-binding protein